MKKLLFTFSFFLFLFNSIAQQKVKFIPKGGVYVGLEEVRLEIPEEFKVYYTLDGTIPNRYSKRADKSLKIKGNTVFRFAVYDSEGNKEVISQSYFTEREHILPIVSLVTDPANLFDSLTGIYEKGCCADSVAPYMGANFWKDEEKDVNIEFIEVDNNQTINQAAGIKIFGGYSVSMPQKSFALYARKEYGTKRFYHSLFPQLPFDKYKNFILRNAGGDMKGTHFRDVFATQLVKETGLAIQEYRPVSVYINGEYWGKYNMREKINEHYINAHYDYPKDSTIIMRFRGDIQHGSSKDYEFFIKKVPSLDMTKKEDLSYLNAEMDIDNYILYNICEIYTGNADAGGNIRYFKHTSDTSKWRWIFYDLDMAMNYNGPEQYKVNSIKNFTTYKKEIWPNPPWSTLIIRKILENDSLKYRYVNRFCDLLNTTFEPNRALTLIDTLRQEVDDEMHYHFKRWELSRDGYEKNIENLRIFVRNRPDLLYDSLRERFNLGEPMVVKIKVPEKGGKVKFNSLEITGEFSGNYFQGVPIHIEAVENVDYNFKEWKNLTSLKQKDYKKFSKDTLVLIPVFEKKPWSEFHGHIQITEVDATQNENVVSNDWLEIYNNSDKKIDLSGWSIRDNKDDHHFIFPEGLSMEPGSFLIATEDTMNFKEVYSDTFNLIGNIPFGINKLKDKIRIYDAGGNLVDRINLKKFPGLERDTSNWAKVDYRIIKFDKDNWWLETPTPGKVSLGSDWIKKKEETDVFRKFLILYIGIGAGGLVVLLFLFILLRNKRIAKQ